jgi:hypothetical protein
MNISIGANSSGAWVTDTSDSDYVSPSAVVDTKIAVPNSGTAITFKVMSVDVTYGPHMVTAS